MYIVQCTVFSIQCSLYSVHCTVHVVVDCHHSEVTNARTNARWRTQTHAETHAQTHAETHARNRTPGKSRNFILKTKIQSLNYIIEQIQLLPWHTKRTITPHSNAHTKCSHTHTPMGRTHTHKCARGYTLKREEAHACGHTRTHTYMYNLVQCTMMYTARCTLYDNIQFTVYSVQYELYNVHRTLYTVYCIVYNVHSILIMSSTFSDLVVYTHIYTHTRIHTCMYVCIYTHRHIHT